jgi:hypothetical protein
MRAMTVEPEIVQGEQPEDTLQKAIVMEIRSLLDRAACRYVLLENFGLDIAVFIQDRNQQHTYFLELKAFVGSRGGGVGFGNRSGQGLQVDLLLCSEQELQVVDSCIRWVLVDGTRQWGTKRYAMFTCIEARQAVMGRVARGKQNNLKVNAFADRLLSWDQLSATLGEFLLA